MDPKANPLITFIQNTSELIAIVKLKPGIDDMS